MNPIVVLGAGMAGLTAADALVAAGREVVVLEARDQPGGRVQTLREPFADGLYAEAGPARIPECHDLTLALARRLRLGLAPFRPGAPAVRAKGRLFTGPDDPDLALAFGFSDAERAEGPAALRRRLVTDGVRRIGDPLTPGWPQGLEAIDALSGAQFLRALGASQGAVEWLSLGGAAVDPESSALTLFRELALHRPGPYYRIVGGNDLLPRRLAETLGGRIRYGAVVRRVMHGADGVRVETAAPSTVSGDRLICTIPCTVLRDIAFSPALPVPMARAVGMVRGHSMTRVFLQTRGRWWANRPGAGFAVTDHPIDIFDATHGQPGERGILLTYARDVLARRLAALPEGERRQWAEQAVEQVFPGPRGQVEAVAFKSWDDDPFSRGGVADFAPGQMTAVLPYLGRAVGRLHFAGEHTSPWAGWIQGAIESGLRAAREVLAST